MIYKILILITLKTGVCLANSELPVCKNISADKLAKAAYKLQQNNNTLKALETYLKGIEADASCADLHYEIGWSYWKLGEWEKVIYSWEKALAINPEHKKIPQYIESARENLKIVNSGKKDNVYRKGTPLFSQSLPKDSPVQLTLIQRWQAYNKDPELISDHYDEDIFSPKSIQFSQNGEKVFVHSLEGYKTVVFNKDGSKKLAVINHNFKNAMVDKNIIDSKAPFTYKFSHKKPYLFQGKPVESILSHAGKYLWVTYYRRDYDELGQDPSAVAIIDTESLQIKRVMGTGPISKYIEKSPDEKWMAISNWGDNTVGIYKINSQEISQFKEHQLLVVEKKHPLKNLKANRDKDCGFCIRGLSFSKDSKYLFVSRMKGGGISIFRIAENDKFNYLTTVFGIQPGTRDLHLNYEGNYLFAGCNATGTIAKIPIDPLLKLVEEKKSNRIELNSRDLEKLNIARQFVGLGVRSFKLHPKLNYLFATSNNGSEIIILKTEDLKVLGRVPADSFPVGLGISPNGKYIWVTSQGKNSVGGNSVSVFLISEYLSQQIILDDGKIDGK